ncbi:MAG: hypothetical protein KR126chlam2_00666 [Chlamydiae bacterium]|nr:hypothetical protein [Chlamydiota bacterium]
MLSQEKRKITPVADLHCDLLSYLAHGGSRSYQDPEVRCSYPQLMKGHIFFQTLAIFVETKKGCAAFAAKQIEVYKNLPAEKFIPMKTLELPTSQDRVHMLPAIENLSGLCDEKEELELAFQRIDEAQQTIGPLLYISLTWNDANRFGGGSSTSLGLKKDGKAVLEYLSGKKVAIDLSHTSDTLAYDILDFIDKNNLKLIPIASHSNFRKVVNQPRNLPDELAQEIIRRGGVIGFNLVRRFLGEDPLKHIEHGLSLGGSDHLCFGADFFFDGDLPSLQIPFGPFFDTRFADATCYPKLLELFSEKLSKEKIAYQNLASFLERMR